MTDQVFIIGLLFGIARGAIGLACGFATYRLFKRAASIDVEALEVEAGGDGIQMAFKAFERLAPRAIMVIIAWLGFIALLVADPIFLRPKTQMPATYKGEAEVQLYLQQREVDEIPPAQFDSNLKDMQDEVDTIRERFDALPDAPQKDASGE